MSLPVAAYLVNPDAYPDSPPCIVVYPGACPPTIAAPVMQAKCIHHGEPTGDLVTCPTCKGH